MRTISDFTLPASTLQGVIAEFRKKPGAYNYALIGSGTLSHLLMANMLEVTGTTLEPIGGQKQGGLNNTVSVATPISGAASTMRRRARAPASWPSACPMPRADAQRRLPSMMMAR